MEGMQSLRVLNLMGNPVRSKVKFYRKILTIKCKDLQHLDDRPVFPRDRACAEAWRDGGDEAEEATRLEWIRAEQKKINDSVDALIRLKNRRNEKHLKNGEESTAKEGNSSDKSLQEFITEAKNSKEKEISEKNPEHNEGDVVSSDSLSITDSEVCLISFIS